MKKFENLGRCLSKNEQKLINGGVSVPNCPSGYVNCGCNDKSIKCCKDYISQCVANYGCSTNYACATN